MQCKEIIIGGILIYYNLKYTTIALTPVTKITKYHFECSAGVAVT